jgi:hypothetical protein
MSIRGAVSLPGFLIPGASGVGDAKFPLSVTTRRCSSIFSPRAVIFHFFVLSIVIQTIKLDITPHYGGARKSGVRFMPDSENSGRLVF